ncbi:MAG: 8-amino-7-oxononanoate synthase [Planctomycetes bacterium]|nr:8-amino-7-oxononanoate synthase [Planctomycetota bacterium]
MSSSLAWITDALQALKNEGLLRSRRVTRMLPDGTCEVDSRRVLDFASNDYLNLAGDPRVIGAAMEALRTGTVGARASPLVSGRSEWHERLEQTIAQFEEQPEALLFPTGMAANVGTIAAICGAGDLILCDRANHASLVDGCRLSQSQMRVYRHDDLTTLERELKKGDSVRRRWIVTDSVFSMDGDIAPLADLCDIAEQNNAELIVDEAHATGVIGENGRGACEALGVEDRVAVRIGTLSKAIGAQGGFVSGPANLIEFLWNRARSQIYSTALSPAVCAAATAAIGIIRAEPWRRHRLEVASEFFRTQLRLAGVETVATSTGPIVPVILHAPEAALNVANRLENRGFLVGAIRPPTVPRDTSRLRIVVTAAHQDADLTRLATAVFEEVTAARAE